MPGRASKRSFCVIQSTPKRTTCQHAKHYEIILAKLVSKMGCTSLQNGPHLPFRVAAPSPHGGPHVLLQVGRQAPSVPPTGCPPPRPRHVPPEVGPAWYPEPRNAPSRHLRHPPQPAPLPQQIDAKPGSIPETIRPHQFQHVA